MPQLPEQPEKALSPPIAYSPDAARLFELGCIVATPAALDLLNQVNIRPSDLLWRHERGDWGNIDNDDAVLNRCAVHSGGRVLSSYALGEGRRLWIITEHDRSVTTLLLPEEY